MGEPQRKQIRFGLVTPMVVTNPPNGAKSDTCVEVPTKGCRDAFLGTMSRRTRGATRGDWERRIRKEGSRNLGEPTERTVRKDAPNGGRECISVRTAPVGSRTRP